MRRFTAIIMIAQLGFLAFFWIGSLPAQDKKDDKKETKKVVVAEAYVVIHTMSAKPGTKIEIVGIKPTLLPSKTLKEKPQPEVKDNTYFFRNRELRLRPSPLPGTLNVILEGTVSSIVVIEVPEGIPMYFGKRPEAKTPPEPKKGL